MVNDTKKSDPRFIKKWEDSGAIGYGKAYAFFNCNASREEIEGEIPTIRELVRTPEGLELSLTESMGDGDVKGDSKLLVLAKDRKLAEIIAEAKGFRQYFLPVRVPGVSNKVAADELAAILNQAYQSPLYQVEEPFVGDIFYKERGNYVPRE